MIYQILAELVLLGHLLFIAFGLLGGYLVLRWWKVIYLHLPAVAWGIYIWTSGNNCPLTPLEKNLRASAGGTGYNGGFIEHYLVSIIYPDGLTPAIQYALAAVLIGLNVGAYLLVWRTTRQMLAVEEALETSQTDSPEFEAPEAV